MNENIAITIAGAVVSIISIWRRIKDKESALYNWAIFFLGVFLVIASIHKENKDVKNKSVQFTQDSLKDVAADKRVLEST